ncbi:MAG: hypothetical protein MJ239_04180 [Bacilli bacterium]|nr:hypothetical protein [Bacilli bacterium]
MKLFSNYVSTKDPSQTRGGKQVIKVVDAPFHVVDALKRYMKENDYVNISVQEEFNDIYGERFGYEVSFVVAQSDGCSLIQISVYDESKRWRVRSEFKKVYEEIERLFEGKLAK